MSKILHQTLKDYLNITEPNTKYKDIIIKRLEDEITREIINENIEEIQIREKEAFKKKILKEKLQNAKEVAFTAIVIGFFVGLLVKSIYRYYNMGKIKCGRICTYCYRFLYYWHIRNNLFSI